MAPVVSVAGLDRTNHRRFGAALALVCGPLLIIAIVFEGTVQAIGFQAIATCVILTTFFVGFLIAKSTSEGVWSFPLLFFIVLSLFHGGLLITPALGGEVAEFLRSVSNSWYTTGQMIRASYLIGLGLLSYGVAVGCWTALSRDTAHNAAKFALEKDTVLRSCIVDVGALLLVGSIVYWYMASSDSSGPLFFLQSYGEFRLQTLESSLGTSYLLISLGAVFVAQDPRRPLAVIGLSALLLFTLMALAIGLRSSALIPVLAAVAVYARGHRMPSMRVFMVVFVLGLIGISAVQQVRVEGFSESDLSDLSASPVKAVEEMGYSARTVVTSIDWHEVSNDPYRHGITYWAPIERGIASLIGAPRIDADSDFRLMNVEIASRVGQIGGSIIAEAHHNFGAAGVIIICGLAGLLLSGAATRRPSASNLAVAGLIMVLLLMHVRNSFAPIPAWAVVGIAVIGLAHVIAWVKTHVAR